MRYPRLALISLIVFTLTVLVGSMVVLAMSTYAYYSWFLNDKDRIMNKNREGIVLEDQSGIPFFTFYGAKTMTYVPLGEIPLVLQQAVIASEDKKFYTNPGFSFKSTVRAFIANLTQGRVVEGGSTISQQLVKNTLLSPQKDLIRKFQEIVLAYALTQRYSKTDILEMYANSVYFGEGAIGVSDAARVYFNQSVSDLTLSQAALLIGLLPAPSNLSNDMSKAKDRQRHVLNEMVEEKYITPEEATQAYHEKLNLNSQKTALNQTAPHFALYVRDMLIKTYGEAKLKDSGFVVKTTLNRAWQGEAERELEKQVNRLSRNRVTNGAVVVINPDNGHIEAMVGSVNWHNERFGKTNMAVAPRQSGSAFKPLIYAAALDNRLITPATVLQDVPTVFPGKYKPVNYDRNFRGPVTVRRALANSLNVPAVEVMERVGLTQALSFADRLGISTLGQDTSKYGLSLILGSGPVPLLQLTNAYAAFANKGLLYPPVAIIEVHDKYGKVIKTINEPGKQVISPETAFLISSILSDDKTRREEFGGALDNRKEAAVKTGTTSSYRDALTVGYTKDIVVGVWIGNNNNMPMDSVAGSLGAAPIWRHLIETYLQDSPTTVFVPPPTVEQAYVCGLGTGLTATGSAYPEYFIRGTSPNGPCTSRYLANGEGYENNPPQKDSVGEDVVPEVFPSPAPTPYIDLQMIPPLFSPPSLAPHTP